MRIKVCGMKYPDNMQEVAELAPDFLGFIFYKGSSRYFEGEIPATIRTERVGVFVNSDHDEVIGAVAFHDLNAIQLHGDESPEYCKVLKQIIGSGQERKGISVIKAFNVSEDFDFEKLGGYEDSCDYFLFDAKGELPGGNGLTFDWRLLENYKLKKPFFLSGGIGPESIEDLKVFMKSDLAEHCHAIDVNSGFEDRPGLKNYQKLKQFKKAL